MHSSTYGCFAKKIPSGRAVQPWCTPALAAGHACAAGMRITVTEAAFLPSRTYAKLYT